MHKKHVRGGRNSAHSTSKNHLVPLSSTMRSQGKIHPCTSLQGLEKQQKRENLLARRRGQENTKEGRALYFFFLFKNKTDDTKHKDTPKTKRTAGKRKEKGEERDPS